MQLVTTQHLFFCFPIKMCTFPLFCCFFFFVSLLGRHILSRLSRLVLPQARQLILQHGLTLSDLDRHPEVWRALLKLNWKPGKWGRGRNMLVLKNLSVRIGAAVKIISVQLRGETWSVELTVTFWFWRFIRFVFLLQLFVFTFLPHSWTWRSTGQMRWTQISRWLKVEGE